MPEWLPDLTDDDLDVLVEALEAWETKDFSTEILGDLLEGALPGGGGEKFAAMRQTEKVTREKAKKIRKERSVVLRAKLLTLRDRRRVDRVTSSV